MTEATVEVITPTIAATYLDMSEGNRPIRPTVVSRYADDMTAGRWRLTGEPIIFNGTALINGHHRLRACIAADVPFSTVVVRGVAADAYDVIDSGVARTAGDVAAQHGFTDANNKASIARLYYLLSRGNIRDVKTAPSRALLIEFMELQRRRLDWVVPITRSVNVALPTANRSAAGAALMWLEDFGSTELVEMFVEPIISGAGLAVGSPQLAARNYFVNAAQLAHGRQNVPRQITVYVRAWNAWIEGRDIHHVKPWIAGQAYPEPVRFTA